MGNWRDQRWKGAKRLSQHFKSERDDGESNEAGVVRLEREACTYVNWLFCKLDLGYVLFHS